ncbi:hypothetical protein [Halioxenophilus aromaticivorans]|uniref:O-antigen ligase domain-containing protein n=1 Tax=Halioxenophilus aromaticivorans TaxID=1306992 RepID=A0AAV3U0T8_9ALTE
MITLNWQDERVRTFLPYVAGAFAGLLAGFVVATSNFALVALLGAMACGSVIALYPVAIFWVTLLVSFVLSGLAQLYYPQLELIRWAVLPLGFLLLGYIFVQSLAANPNLEVRRQPNALVFLLCTFLIVNMLPWFLNPLSFSDFFVGFKGYFQMWGFMFGMCLLAWDQKMMRDTLPKAIFVLALIQIPFALHQYVFIAPLREHGVEKGVVPLDIVTGTFGGQKLGGGANAVLAVFLLAVWACVLGVWKKQRLNTFWLVLISAGLLLPVMINEAKVSIIYAVVVFFVIFRKGVFQNIGRFLTVTALVFAMVAALFSTYISHAPAGAASSWTGLITYTIEYNINKQEETDGKLTRGASINLWFDRHGDMAHTLLGYGVGTSRVEKHNHLARAIGIKEPQDTGVGKLGAIAVLWESGLIGFLIISSAFGVAFYYACQLEKTYSRDGWLSGIFVGLQGAIVILYISMWHKNFFILHIGYQAIYTTLFGFLIYWRKAKVPDFEEADEQEELIRLPK